MNKIDLAYMAGFFDGEGSIAILRARVLGKFGRYYLSYQPRIVVVQTGEKGEEICKWFQSNFEGNIYNPKRIKPYHAKRWEWVISHTTAFLIQIYPYLKIKKKQAELVFEFRDKLLKNKQNPRPLEYKRIERLCYYETAKREMSFLNGQKVKEVSWMK